MKNIFNGGSKSIEFDVSFHDKSGLVNNTKKKDVGDAYYEEKTGSYNQIPNDFSLVNGVSDIKHFENDPNWSPEETEKIRKFRFVVAFLVLIGFALCLMSRMVLSVGIVCMTAKPTTIATNSNTTTTPTDDISELFEKQQISSLEGIRDIPSVISREVQLEEEVCLDMSTTEKNYLIASFYVGYAPTMMFTGGLANKYGSWYPLFIAVFSSVFFNAITPTVAFYSYPLLVGTRVVLGILQGCIMPAAYDIFNRWLTLNEAGIFVPMIKVSFAVGSLLGNALPGVTSFFGYQWPMMFYECSFLCAIWSVFWFFLATSTPQTNSWVKPNELKRIMRKKQQVAAAPLENQQQAPPPAEESTPWLLIMFSPSVLALALTKFTYNIGMDFVCLELPIYLRNIHNTEQEIISTIGSVGCLLQAVLITFIGWLARYVVQNKTFGLNKSKWRKTFQGFSNFGMAIAYFIIIFSNPSFISLVLLLLVIYFSWMLGAGGESLIPYDLSTKYPATIMGYAHSFGVLSSVVLPPFCSLILGDDDTSQEKWNLIFLYLACACTVGGLAFILIVKPKPFLPGEVETSKKKTISIRE